MARSAKPAPKPPKPSPKPPKPAKNVHGTIIALDAAGSWLTIKQRGTPVSYAVDSQATITLDKKPATFADLQIGMNTFLAVSSAVLVVGIDARTETGD